MTHLFQFKTGKKHRQTYTVPLISPRSVEAHLGMEIENLVPLRKINPNRMKTVNALASQQEKTIFPWGDHESLMPDDDSSGDDEDLEKILKDPKRQVVELRVRKDNGNPIVKKTSKAETKRKLARRKDPAWWDGFGTGHFTWIIPSKRYSGKSVLLNRLVGNLLVSRDDVQRDQVDGGGGKPSKYQFFEKKILISPTAHRDESLDTSHFDEVVTGDEQAKDGGRQQINEVIQRIMRKRKYQSTLLVLDDCMGLIGHTGADLINRFSTRNRHYGTSILLATQCFKSISPTLRVNTSQWCIFRCINSDERNKMMKELEAVRQFYDKIDWEDEPFQFLYIRDAPGPKTLVYREFEEFLGFVSDKDDAQLERLRKKAEKKEKQQQQESSGN